MRHFYLCGANDARVLAVVMCLSVCLWVCLPYAVLYQKRAWLWSRDCFKILSFVWCSTLCGFVSNSWATCLRYHAEKQTDKRHWKPYPPQQP